MGQGTDSCGGSEWEYDPYDEGLESGTWTTRDGVSITPSQMTLRHLKGARRVAQSAAMRATFSCDEEKFDEWVAIFDAEIESRERKNRAKEVDHKKIKAPSRGTKATMICHCGRQYQAREADLKRGWAKSCSKSCAATRRDFGRPSAKRKT